MITTPKRGGLQQPTGHDPLTVAFAGKQSVLRSAGFESLTRWDQYGCYLPLPGQGSGLLVAMLAVRHAATQGWIPIAAVTYSVTDRGRDCPGDKPWLLTIFGWHRNLITTNDGLLTVFIKRLDQHALIVEFAHKFGFGISHGSSGSDFNFQTVTWHAFGFDFAFHFGNIFATLALGQF